MVCAIGAATYVNAPQSGWSQSATISVPTAKLNSGYEIPLLGLGTSGATGKDAYDAVKSGIDIGYRHIDTAAIYGNEEDVGAALADVLKAGKVKREELFITTKLWSDAHARDAVEPALNASLQRLQLDYVDLYLVHWPVTNKPGPTLNPPAEETWAGLEQVADKGLARSIGVSNQSPEKITAWYTNARIPPAVNQIEVHPNWRNQRVVDFAKEHNILITAYAPLSSPGTMASRHLPVPNLAKDHRITEIAKANGQTPQQVLIQWGIAHGDTKHISVIPKSANSQHQKNNFEALTGTLSQADFDKISSFEPQTRYFPGDGLAISDKGPWHTYQELWDEPPPST